MSQNPAQAATGKVLIVFSGVEKLSLQGGTSHKTGFFLSELTEMVNLLKKNGYEITYANPSGRRPALAPDSDSAQWFKSEAAYRQAKELVNGEVGLEKPRLFSSFTESELRSYSGVFAPGGYAPMEDLPANKDLGKIFHYFHTAKKPTAAVCHGPVALLSPRELAKDKPWDYAGYKMTIVSKSEEKEEEEAGHLSGGRQLYYVEDALRAGGGILDIAKSWTPHVVQDRELITGQNPMSASMIAEKFNAALNSSL